MYYSGYNEWENILFYYNPKKLCKLEQRKFNL